MTNGDLRPGMMCPPPVPPLTLRPGKPIGEERLLAAGQQLDPLCGGELQEPSQSIQGLLIGMLLTVSKMLQEWEHETLKIWNWHRCTVSVQGIRSRKHPNAGH
jgi:hypothetical protein